MKKNYLKPNADYMELRPEEQLAVCSWPAGFQSTPTYSCATTTFQQIPELNAYCVSQFNNAQSTGS